ncbi:MAG: WG repeat-containing protein [Bacteroides sp.]|nr:WG repeat-containing protein [Bacteroides sp.]
MNIKYLILLVCILTVKTALSADLRIFEKKGKYGLEDKNTGKIILKAKYDSIYPFHGNYARIEKNNKYGIIDKNGAEYLPCKYKSILQPIARSSFNKDYFWVSPNGISYFLTSNTNYYTNVWSNVIYGPDNVWYGCDANGRWFYGINDPNTVPRPAKFKDNILRRIRLPKRYLLFNDKLYSPQRTLIAQNVVDVDTMNIKGNRFIIATIDNPAQKLLIDLSSEIVWRKENSNRNGYYHTDLPEYSYLLGVDNDNIFHLDILTDGSNPIYIIKNLEYDLSSVHTASKELLPFRFNKILIDKNAGILDSKPLWKITLECKQPILESELSDFVETLNSNYPNFIIEAKTSMGRSLFGNTGKELVHNNLQNVSTHDGLLIVKFDGKNHIAGMNGIMTFEQYDNVWQSEKGNLTSKDFVVSKGNKVGLYVEGQGEVIPPLYDGVSRLQGHIFVYKDDLVGLYDNNGHKITDPKYKSIEAGYYYPTNKNYFAVKNASGNMMIIDNSGNAKIPPGQIDRVDFLSGEEGKWGKVYKNGKMGIVNLQTFKIVVPCNYEDNIFFGDGHWSNRKIGVYRKTTNGDVVDIWIMSGKKVASRVCPTNTPYLNKRWIENQLNAHLYYN